LKCHFLLMSICQRGKADTNESAMVRDRIKSFDGEIA